MSTTGRKDGRTPKEKLLLGVFVHVPQCFCRLLHTHTHTHTHPHTQTKRAHHSPATTRHTLVHGTCQRKKEGEGGDKPSSIKEVSLPQAARRILCVRACE